MEEIKEYIAQMVQSNVSRLILSKPVSKSEPYKKIIIEEKGSFFQIAQYTEKQVFHQNIIGTELEQKLYVLFSQHFMQINAWSEGQEHILLLSKKGNATYKRRSLAKQEIRLHNEEHNRKKNYILEEGNPIAPLVDMGIFTADGKIVHAMYDKYKQINRFLEILDDEVGNLKEDQVNVIDFGCGKSYLTFVVYYYLSVIKKKKAKVIGLDLKKDVIQKCNTAAEKYGYRDLRFELGDINGYKAPFRVDIVITLHACDTATDYALYNAIQWNAKMIFSVPCCQHELNKQIKAQNMNLMTHYGIIKERFSALATDAIRGNLLEYCGYRTQLLEFIDFEHTPKNILIRAVRRPITSKGVKQQALKEIHAVMDEFSFAPTLYQLLGINRENLEIV